MKLRTVIGACTLIAAIPFTTQAGLNSNGNWDVTRGDTLYNIARRVAPGNGKEQARIRKHMFNANPSAFKNNNPGALEVGKTLSLPGAAAVVVRKPNPAPKPKAVVKPKVIVPAVVAPIVSAPKVSVPTPAISVPKPKVAAPAADSFKARIEAKRIAKEAADKRRADATRLAAEQAAQKQAAAAQQQAAQQAAAKQQAAAAMAAKQKAAAAAAARQKAAAQAAAAKKAAAAKAAKPKPAPRAVKANNTTNSANPYVECKTSNPDEQCGNWNITYKK